MPEGMKVRSVSSDLLMFMTGMMIGNVYYVDGTNGNDGARGDCFSRALKTLYIGNTKLTAAHHDYLLCVGAETSTAVVSPSAANSHIIGIGAGGVNNEFSRGFVYSRVATAVGLSLATTADYMEIAGICFIEPATDAILVDDLGATGVYFHHNTVYGSTTASVAIRLDIEGDRWTIADNNFFLCKLAIDTIGPETVIRRNIIQDVSTTAKGVNLSANTADRCIVDGNIFNLSGGTTDVALTIVSGADQCLVSNNLFNASCSDAISNSGTGTMLINNWSAAITGTSGASLVLAINN